MNLAEVAQILSIITSAIAVLVSLYGFARFVRRLLLRSRSNAGRTLPPAWSPIRERQLGPEPDEGGGEAAAHPGEHARA